MTERTATVERNTAETKIKLTVNLDGTGDWSVATGIGFFDHMLSHIAKHGVFDLHLEAEGDLHIDPHHTIEDCGLALGQAFAEATGDKAGLVRAGSFTMPLDEALAFAAVDLGGRPYTVLDMPLLGRDVGGIPPDLFGHFFESFASTARANIHLTIIRGVNDHHKIEAAFKAFGRALDAATRIDPRRQGSIPSTKGTL